MKTRFFMNVLLYFILNVFCWYYVAVFCTLYQKSVQSWIQGAFISVIMDLGGISLVLPLLQSAFRALARKIPALRY